MTRAFRHSQVVIVWVLCCFTTTLAFVVVQEVLT